MVRRFAIALMSLTLLGGVAGCGGEDEPDVTEEANFTATTPEGWEVGDEEALQAGGTAAIATEREEGRIPEDVELQVEFLALWYQSDAEDFRTNINVFREPVEPNEEEGYLRFSQRGIEQGQGVSVEVSDGPSVDGTPSNAFDYTATVEDFELDVRTLTAFRDGYAYNITATAPVESSADADAALDEIISSWSWES
jgi:hypothetical protein